VAHHETLNGKGYPRGLKAEQLSIPARILAIADIFEALTASDRPYRKPLGTGEAMRILVDFRDRGNLDGDLVELFIRSDIWRRYGENYLSACQMEAFDPDEILGAHRAR
jgi:HD-GYP domain-containing protein (c-di-GMP phosphodiesterase class II)